MENGNFGKHPMKAKELTVVAVVEQQGFDVRIDLIEKIVTYARFLAFVEKVAVEQIFLGLGKNDDFHVIRSLNSLLTWFESS